MATKNLKRRPKKSRRRWLPDATPPPGLVLVWPDESCGTPYWADRRFAPKLGGAKPDAWARFDAKVRAGWRPVPDPATPGGLAFVGFVRDGAAERLAFAFPQPAGA